MFKVNSFLHVIDCINNRVGQVVSFVILPLVFLATFEVIMRYIFNRPTIWVWDIVVQIGSLIVILGGGYTLLQKGHVIIDIIAIRLSIRARTIIEIITGLLFLFTLSILLWKSCEFASYSLQLKEHTNSFWGPPIYPLKIMMPIGILLLLLQGLAKFIRDIKLLVCNQGGK